MSIKDEDRVHLELLNEHITSVQTNCQKIARGLFECGKDDIALRLLARAQVHDNSKFYGIEWKYLRTDVKESTPDLFQCALESHWSNNEHHPEYHPNGIQDFNEVLIHEFVADTKARSSEFGTDFWDWMKNTAFEKYHVKVNSRVYKTVRESLTFLLEKPFS